MSAAEDLLTGPAYEVTTRLRPVAVVQPGTTVAGAPCAAVEAAPADPVADVTVGLSSRGTTLRARREAGRAFLEVEHAGRTTRHESRRFARVARCDAVALALTGDLATVLTREGDRWTARALLHLDHTGPAGLDVHDEDWLADLHPVGEVSAAGRFGQLGLRDPRLVSHADGSAVTEDGRLLLTATSAGPGGFRSGHTSVWSLDPAGDDLQHRADLFFRRSERAGVLGDHATHLVRDGDTWLVATSTWGDFDPRTAPRVGITLARTDVDVLRGTHVLDTVPLQVPTTGLRSVGTWDPHLVRTREGWLVTYVSATRFFSFHPVLAEGPDLASLRLRAAASARTACEGPTLVPSASGWRVVASHGRDGRGDREGRPATYPVLDLDLREVGTLAAHYPSNLPWPTLAETAAGPVLIGFDGEPQGGPLLGYGTHGDLVLQRRPAPSPARAARATGLPPGAGRPGLGEAAEGEHPGEAG